MITPISNQEEYLKMYNESKDPNTFWAKIASNFEWVKDWESVLSGSFETSDVKWFNGAELNITTNCLDRHALKTPDKIALKFISNDPNAEAVNFTYSKLLSEVNKTSNMLKSLGIKKGDRVILYMGMVPELLISVLSCARIGAIHSVVFAGFSAQALAGRIEDARAKLIIASDVSRRGDKVIKLKEIVDQALKMDECKSIEKLLIHKVSKDRIEVNPDNEYIWNKFQETFSEICPAENMKSEDPLFTLYTSGSTGKPKGIVHTTAGYMIWASYTFANVFQMKSDDDLFWCTADIGWITGHTYLTYGPLLNGKTTVMFEGVPTWPDASRFWAEIAKHKITHFYTAPTAIRALMACGDEYVQGHDLSSLKVIGSVGEPINDEAWHWYDTQVGKNKCPIVDTWWQTETGGILISPLAGITKTIPCFATNPLPGVFPILVDEKGEELLELSSEGRLCIKTPWPGMARSIWQDHERYIQTYFSTFKGLYFTGDGCRRDANGNYRITGRVDDVINVSGHRIGTAEVEDAIDQHPLVVESAVVGFPHDIKGQGIYAFVILHKNNSLDIKKEINESVVKYIGPIARPDKILVVDGLPKTRSGKIMRRILRKIASGEYDNFGDISTLLDPSVVEEIKQKSLL